jgi:hypothetical protein
LVLVVAKALMVSSQSWSLTPWLPVAWFSQDLLIGALLWLVDFGLGRPRAAWFGYGIGVVYVAVNVSIATATGSPLTMVMLGAAGGPLADSIAHSARWDTLVPAACVVLAGLLLPIAGTRIRLCDGGAVGRRVQVTAALVACGGAWVLGSMAVLQADTRGLHRNALTALLPLGVPASVASPVSGDWRASPLPAAEPPHVDLTRYRGAAAGMNVVMVVLESTGAQYLAPYGGEHDPMPTLSALSRRAILFENAYASYPESIKGLLATLCSTHPSFNEPAEVQASKPCDSIARSLQQAGYQTSLFHSGRFGYLGMDAVVADRGFDTIEDAGAIGGNVRSSFGVDEPATVNRILRWIDGLDPGRPFFVTYLPIAGHHPYGAPAGGPFTGDTELRRYLNALHDADEALGRLIAGLRLRELEGRTLLLVFGDHGEAFGQHPGNTGHSLFIYEENIRVPYLIAIPGVTESTTRVPGVASLVDTAPTILDLLGLRPARRHQGTSLLQPGSRMALFLADYSLGWLGLRDACWKYQFETGSGRSALFDVCADPGETRNLAGREPARVRAYRRHVEQWSRRDALFTRSGPSP